MCDNSSGPRNCKVAKLRCFVVGCKFEKREDHRSERKRISFFQTPKIREVFEQWVQYTGQKQILDMAIDVLQRRLYICQLHFKELQGGIQRRRISQFTVPSLSLDGHVPLSDEQMNGWRKMDHYIKFWSAFECATPCKSVQRCPNLPKDSSDVYCQTTGPFPCLYCETAHPTQTIDPDMQDFMLDFPITSQPSAQPSFPTASVLRPDSSPYKVVPIRPRNVSQNHLSERPSNKTLKSPSKKLILDVPTRTLLSVQPDIPPGGSSSSTSPLKNSVDKPSMKVVKARYIRRSTPDDKSSPKLVVMNSLKFDSNRVQFKNVQPVKKRVVHFKAIISSKSQEIEKISDPLSKCIKDKDIKCTSPQKVQLTSCLASPVKDNSCEQFHEELDAESSLSQPASESSLFIPGTNIKFVEPVDIQVPIEILSDHQYASCSINTLIPR